MNDLTIYQPDLIYQKAPVIFSNYQLLKQQAQEVADFVSSIVVTEDTIKAAKKMVAETRKSVKTLDTKRLEIKKAILEDFTIFETQVLELKKIVDDADQKVRSQVKHFEELERNQKKKDLKELFEKRVQMYNFSMMPFLFEKWLKPSHLNKSMSMNKCEKDMTDFLEGIQRDLEAIQKLSNASDIMAHYVDSLDLNEAIAREELFRKQKEAASAIQIDDEELEEPEERTWQAIPIYCTAAELKKAKTILMNAGFELA